MLGVDADAQDLPLDARLEAQWERFRARIEAHRHLLAGQGSLVLKGGKHRTCWRLRFYQRVPDGRVVQRSVHVGAHPELVRRARLLLEAYRRPRELMRETAALVRVASALAGALGRRVPLLRPPWRGDGSAPSN